MSSSRRWLRRGLVAAAVVVVGVAAAVAFVLLHKPGNVSHPGVEFTRSTATTPPHPTASLPPFEWLRYGYDAARTRDVPNTQNLHPPFRRGWKFEDFALLEFPPVIYGNTLYIVDDDGSAKALDKRTGHKLWETKVGTLAAASPALGLKQGLVFIPILSASRGARVGGNGRIVALSMKTGRVAWSRRIAPGTESSPLAWDDSVYFGDQAGTVYSLNAADGHVNWTYRAKGAVKGGPALANGKLFFGDYAGRAYALNPATGHPIWARSTNGAQFGFGSGNFYSTPAVAFGRVYMGNTDGRVYSFAERNGQLAWATGTRSYVYASAAVADVPGMGPTVLVGSYDGHFYAFNARTGAIRWSHPAGGRISGSATVVGGVVYFSTLGSKTTSGLDIHTGHRVFFFPDGAFNPVVCDYDTIYLSGYSTLYQLLPVRKVSAPARASKEPSHRSRKASARARRRHR